MSDAASPNWSPAQRRRLEAWQVDRSVDVHCHCLHGLDDGPGALEESLELCRALIADGVTTVVASPHQLGRYDGRTTATLIRRKLGELREALAAEDLPLELTAGADVRIDERLARLVAQGEALTAGPAGKHLLLELPTALFVDPLSTIAALGEQGVQAIMTHPERHRYLAGGARRVAGWVDAGAAVQITAGSLLGDFGRGAEEEAWSLVAAGVVSLVASDAHDARQRPPRLSAALDVLTQRVGRGYAGDVCLRNPLKVLRGESVAPCQP